jgi:hypothetical protein
MSNVEFSRLSVKWSTRCDMADVTMGFAGLFKGAIVSLYKKIIMWQSSLLLPLSQIIGRFIFF